MVGQAIPKVVGDSIAPSTSLTVDTVQIPERDDGAYNALILSG